MQAAVTSLLGSAGGKEGGAVTLCPPQPSWPHRGGVKATGSSNPHPATGQGGASILFSTNGLRLCRARELHGSGQATPEGHRINKPLSLTSTDSATGLAVKRERRRDGER